MTGYGFNSSQRHGGSLFSGGPSKRPWSCIASRPICFANESISLEGRPTKTPIRTIPSGRFWEISVARSMSRHRGEPVMKFKPIASAPEAAIIMASSTEVTPHILT